MIIWVFMFKTRDERGGGLPKGGRGACMAAIDIADHVLQKRGPKNGVPALKISDGVLGAHGRSWSRP